MEFSGIHLTVFVSGDAKEIPWCITCISMEFYLSVWASWQLAVEQSNLIITLSIITDYFI